MGDTFRVEDFLLDFPPTFYEGPLVDAPLVVKVYKVGDYLAEVLKACRRCLSVQAEIPAVIACLAAVDYAAGFWAGRESTRADYTGFMRQYFPSDYTPLLDRIYNDLRCGLVHNLVATNPWRKSNGSFLVVTDVPNHLAVESERVVWSVATFIVHTYQAWIGFQHHLIMGAPANVEAVTRFNARFDRLAGMGAFMERMPDPK